MTTPSTPYADKIQATSITDEERETALALQKKQATALDRIKAYAALEEVQIRFTKLLGDKAGQRYVESIIIAVANNEELQKCSPKSIMIQAMRAASMQLSVDPIMHQAHLVPFGTEATLIVDYHGLVQLTVNTNFYIDPPNVTEVYEGEKVKLDRLSGRCEIIEAGRTGDKVIGWLSYYKAKNGTERFLYMTNEECDEHGKLYNPRGFASPKSPWNAHDGRDRDKMRRKTCLRQFVIRWGNFSPVVMQAIMQDEPIDGLVTSSMPSDDIEVPEKIHNPNGLRDLGFEPAVEAEALPDEPDALPGNAVTEKTWDAWQALCQRAEKVNIPYTLVDRSKVIDADLIEAGKWLKAKVVAAEVDAAIAKKKEANAKKK